MSSAIHSLADQESKPRPTLIAPEETASQQLAIGAGGGRMQLPGGFLWRNQRRPGLGLLVF